MILTTLDQDRLRALLPAFRAAVTGHGLACAMLDRITEQIPEGELMRLSLDAYHLSQAVDLCRSFGLGVLPIRPKDWFTWDGRHVACDLEPSVVIHEVAHYQCAAPSRRHLPDFGLGAGPETGVGAVAANAVRRVGAVQADVEEGLTSLLGILWEVALGQPALLAFLEQNWLEGGSDPRNVSHFIKIAETLRGLNLVTDEGSPTRSLRQAEDAVFFDGWFKL